MSACKVLDTFKMFHLNLPTIPYGNYRPNEEFVVFNAKEVIQCEKAGTVRDVHSLFHIASGGVRTRTQVLSL